MEHENIVQEFNHSVYNGTLSDAQLKLLGNAHAGFPTLGFFFNGQETLRAFKIVDDAVRDHFKETQDFSVPHELKYEECEAIGNAANPGVVQVKQVMMMEMKHQKMQKVTNTQ